jgi:hypothetical protein
LTNWAIADVGQDAFDVERMSTTMGNVPSGLTFCRQANRIFYDGNFKVLKDLYFIITDLDTFILSTSLEIVPKYECVAKLK